jgi:hypothetical protein
MPQWQVSLSSAKEIHQCFLVGEFYSSFDFNKSIHVTDRMYLVP